MSTEDDVQDQDTERWRPPSPVLALAAPGVLCLMVYEAVFIIRDSHSALTLSLSALLDVAAVGMLVSWKPRLKTLGKWVNRAAVVSFLALVLTSYARGHGAL